MPAAIMTIIVTLHSSALLLLIATFQQVYLVPVSLCCWTSLLFLMLLGLLKRSSARSWSAFFFKQELLMICLARSCQTGCRRSHGVMGAGQRILL
ncbi:hypothetical protein WJX79_006757 [Trebouxia sp. C0005]